MNADKTSPVVGHGAAVRERFGGLHAKVTDAILACFFDVYNELGAGFLESVYREALAVAFRHAGVDFEREPPLLVCFRGEPVGRFRPDFVVEGVVMVEVKAMRAFDPAHDAQLLNYLSCTDKEVGLLLNFGPRAQFKRLAFSNARKRRPHGPSPHVSK
jgi:GxxExxY protein